MGKKAKKSVSETSEIENVLSIAQLNQDCCSVAVAVVTELKNALSRNQEISKDQVNRIVSAKLREASENFTERLAGAALSADAKNHRITEHNQCVAGYVHQLFSTEKLLDVFPDMRANRTNLFAQLINFGEASLKVNGLLARCENNLLVHSRQVDSLSVALVVAQGEQKITERLGDMLFSQDCIVLRMEVLTEFKKLLTQDQGVTKTQLDNIVDECVTKRVEAFAEEFRVRDCYQGRDVETLTEQDKKIIFTQYRVRLAKDFAEYYRQNPNLSVSGYIDPANRFTALSDSGTLNKAVSDQLRIQTKKFEQSCENRTTLTMELYTLRNKAEVKGKGAQVSRVDVQPIYPESPGISESDAVASASMRVC